MATIPEALALAVQHHQACRLPEAEQIYRQILAVEPEQVDALHLLGVLAHQVGRHDLAIEQIQRAIALNGSEGIYHNNLGEAYRASDMPSQAIACYRRALKLKPDYADAHSNLGYVLLEKGELNEAVVSCRRALEIAPDHIDGHNNLGNALQKQGKLEEAIACYHRALKLRPNNAKVHNNLGNALRAQAKLDEAVACYCQALQLAPDLATAHNNLGSALRELGRFDEAIACYRRTLQLKPNLFEGHNNLGNVLLYQGKPDEAIDCYRRALELHPIFVEAHCNLGNAFKEQGKLNLAVASYRSALELKPSHVEAHDNYILALLYWNQATSVELQAAHAEYNQRFGVPHASRGPSYPNDRSPDRRLRIGYVSPDFYEHAVGRNVLPLFREHDRALFEVFAYAQVRRRDAWTDRFQASSDTWRNIVGLTDEALAAQVREDRIDVLVDLALHTAHNRLLAFARKPAPVQVTFAGYPGTTGLTAIDYRLTDPHLDPSGVQDECYSEQSFSLPNTFWCYDLPGQEPVVNALPAVEKGYVTFGCLNTFFKVNASVLQLWAGVLRQVKGSRLLLLAPEGTSREETLKMLSQEGVTSERVAFASRQPHRQYLEQYHQIDIGLDTFPYNGHTTSLDSYWMGVPVITLAGQTVVGRAGLSQLTNLGLMDLIAQTPEEFVKIAVELAQDLPRLSELRATLRQRMERSPLMDAKGFTRGIEAAYRMMWQRWCAE